MDFVACIYLWFFDSPTHTAISSDGRFPISNYIQRHFFEVGNLDWASSNANFYPISMA